MRLPILMRMDKMINKGGVESRNFMVPVVSTMRCSLVIDQQDSMRRVRLYLPLTKSSIVYDAMNERRQSRVNYLQFLQLFLKRTERSLLMFVELVSLGLCSAESGDLTKAQPT